MNEQKMNYNAKTGDQIEMKTSYGWIEFIVQDSHPNWVSLKDGNGQETHYSYDRLIQMDARFV